jgi:hypothetical protein
VWERPGQLEDTPKRSTEKTVECPVLIKRPARHFRRVPHFWVKAIDNRFYFEFFITEFGVKCIEFAENEVFARPEGGHIVVRVVKHDTQIL